MDSSSDPGYPDIPSSAEIGGYIFEPPPWEPVNQPDSEDESAAIRSSTEQLNAHRGRNLYENSLYKGNKTKYQNSIFSSEFSASNSNGTQKIVLRFSSPLSYWSLFYNIVHIFLI